MKLRPCPWPSLTGLVLIPLHFATSSASPRSSSEDRLAVHQLDGGLVVVVADGAGGLPGGGRAADLALEVVAEAIELSRFSPFTAPGVFTAPGSSPAAGLFTARPWVELLLRADDRIAADRVAGETTLVVVAVAENGCLVGASCGDSGAMVIGLGAVDDLTMLQHRKRRLGSGRALPVAFERAALDGTLVVASDGLFSFVRSDVVVKIVTEHEDLEEVAGALVQAVRLPGRFKMMSWSRW